MDPGDERGETSTAGSRQGRREPPWVARTRTKSARLRGARRVSNGSQAYSRVPQVCSGTGGKLALKPMMGHRKKHVSKSSIRRENETLGCSEHKGVSSRRVSQRRKKLGRVVQPETVRRVDQTAGARSADCLSSLAEAEMKAVDPDQCLDMVDSDADEFEVVPDRDAAVLTGPRVHLEDNPMSSSAKKACAMSLLRCPES